MQALPIPFPTTLLSMCIPSKIQTRQWFVTNYSNNYCLDCTMYTEDFTIFSLDMNFARCLFSFRPVTRSSLAISPWYNLDDWRLSDPLSG